MQASGGAATGIVLSDGTRLEDLFDFEARTVALRVYADPEIFEYERERIFSRAWMVVAHETEIPNESDFVQRRLGMDKVIVSRAKGGQIHVSQNVCTHRGAPVCRTDRGNQDRFVCPYHAWVFKSSGELSGVPLRKDMYGDDFDRKTMGLRQARVESLHGWIFATWDLDAPTLTEYIGPAKFAFDLAYGRTNRKMEVLGPPQRWVIKSNWKAASEQFSGDAYHAGFAHMSMVELGLAPSAAKYMETIQYGIFAEPASNYGDVIERDGQLLPPGLTPALHEEMLQNLTPEQLAFYDQVPLGPGGIGVFPNFFTLLLSLPRLDGVLGPMISPRQWQPISPTELEAYVWVVAEADAPPELKELGRQTAAQTFSSSGVFEVDDAEMWGAIQHGTEGAMVRRQSMDYRSTGKDGPPKPGGASAGFSDNPQWNFWMNWLNNMSDDPRSAPFAEHLMAPKFALSKK